MSSLRETPSARWAWFKAIGGLGVTLARGGLATLSELLARLSFEAFGTGTVEVVLHAVTRGLVLTGVGLAGVTPARNLHKSRGSGTAGVTSETTPMELTEPRYYGARNPH